MNRGLGTASLVVALVCWTPAAAATASFSASASRNVPRDPGIPAAQYLDVYSFFVTTDADIYCVERVGITSSRPLFQVAPPWGSNTQPAPPELMALNPSLRFDSWITTPGETHQLGPDMPGDGSLSQWEDFSRDGPQSNFQFAQLAFPTGTKGRFTGEVSLFGDTGAESFPFVFEIVPEPSAGGLAAIAVLGLTALRGSNKFKDTLRLRSGPPGRN
jgi:hypothetical protein